ncbi:MAG: hypothetical protein ACJ8EN_07280 [Xanthobacteraceae bacterium]
MLGRHAAMCAEASMAAQGPTTRMAKRDWLRYVIGNSLHAISLVS